MVLGMQISFFVFVLSVCCHYCVCMSLPVRWARQHWSGNRWVVLGGKCQCPLGNTLANGCYGSCILVVFFSCPFQDIFFIAPSLSFVHVINGPHTKTKNTQRERSGMCGSKQALRWQQFLCKHIKFPLQSMPFGRW